MNAMESRLVVCRNCGARNRVKADARGKKPVCGKCHAALPRSSGASHRVVEISDRTFEREILAHPGSALVNCWAPWCGNCRVLAPVLVSLAREYGGRIKIASLNVDQNPSTASRYNILSVPTMLLFKNGRLVDTLTGALPKTEIERHLYALQ